MHIQYLLPYWGHEQLDGQGTLERYVSWWQRIVDYKGAQGDSLFTVTPEFGPYPYMPQSPFTQEPLADQWNTNLAIKNHLQTAF